MIGQDKQHSQWLVSYSPSKECTLWVPCHLNSRTSATQAPSATNICETSSSVNICRRNRTLFDNYSVLSFDNISHCRPSDATCHVFTFSPFTLLELEIFSWGNVNHPFLIHDNTFTLEDCSALFTMSPLAASWLSSSSSFWLRCVGQMGLRLTAPYWVCPPLAQMVATPPTNAPISPFSTIFLQPYIFILVVRCVFGCAFQKKL